MKKLVSIVLLSVGVAVSAAGAESASWARGGTAAWPEQTVPHGFDGKSGQNILWRAPLPCSGNGSPIVVGNRVFVTVEPWETYSPWLLCFDADSGKELWRRELDVIAGRDDLDEAAKAARRTSLLASAKQFFEARRLGGQARALREYRSRKSWTVPDGHQAEHDQLIEKLGTLGWILHGRKSAIESFWLERKRGTAMPGFDGGVMKLLEGVEGGTLWHGTTYPTPCSDGQRVYVWTCQDLFAAFTLDGEPVWYRYLPHAATPYEQLTPAQQKLFAGKRPRHTPAYRYSTQPIVVDVHGDGTDRVVVVTDTSEVKCLDADDGKLRWRIEHPLGIGSYGIPQVVYPASPKSSPQQVPPGGTRDAVVITHYSSGFHEAIPGDLLIRASDGLIVGTMPGARVNKHSGTGPIVTSDGLVVTLDRRRAQYWAENGDNVVALRLVWGDDHRTVERRDVWRADLGKASIGSQPAWTDRRLYGRGGLILDLETGKVLSKRSLMGWTAGDYGCVLAGDALVIPGRFNGTYHFFAADADENKELGIGRLPLGDNGKQVMGYDWKWVGGAIPWAAHNRLYIRTFDALWCIGKADGMKN